MPSSPSQPKPRAEAANRLLNIAGLADEAARVGTNQLAKCYDALVRPGLAPSAEEREEEELGTAVVELAFRALRKAAGARE